MQSKVIVIVAGNNEPSNSNMLADKFIEGMKSAGVQEIEKIRLKDVRIDHFSLKHYDETYCDIDDDFCTWVPKMKAAHGLVIATPIWNFSVPAHLKNFIDRMGAFALDQEGHSRGQFAGRPTYFIFTGGAPVIAWKALMYLTTLHVTEAFKYYRASIIGKYFEPKCVLGRGKFGLVVDKRPETLARMQKLGKRFGDIAVHYAENGTLPAKVRWVNAFFSFLYRVGNRMMYPISNLQ